MLDEERFAQVCPWKQAHIGYREWIRRLVRAVPIFGRGFVNTGFVAGGGLVGPQGGATEDERLARTLAAVEELAAEGIAAVGRVSRPAPGSSSQLQPAPSLEYFVRLARGVDALRRRYGLQVDLADYRRGGDHPDTDLARL